MNTLHKLFAVTAAFLAPSLASAGPLNVVNVSAPAINCVFNTSCTVTVTDSVGNFTLTQDSGTGRLQSRTFEGAVATASAGRAGYDYRIDMTEMHGVLAESCIKALKVSFGLPIALAYTPGVASYVYVVTSGGLGSVGPTSASIAGSTITFNFATPVCPGQTSYFFGLASNLRPVASTAQLVPTISGPSVAVPARSAHP